jgi:hypothetical protein
MKFLIFLLSYFLIYYALPISHNHIYTNKNTRIYKLSINDRVYATALRQLQQPLQNEHDAFFIRSLVIYKGQFAPRKTFRRIGTERKVTQC